jgi:hypothetical protein
MWHASVISGPTPDGVQHAPIRDDIYRCFHDPSAVCPMKNGPSSADATSAACQNTQFLHERDHPWPLCGRRHKHTTYVRLHSEKTKLQLEFKQNGLSVSVSENWRVSEPEFTRSHSCLETDWIRTHINVYM